MIRGLLSCGGVDRLKRLWRNESEGAKAPYAWGGLVIILISAWRV